MAVGLLELLWHATAEFASQGDIGRFDNRGIAKLVGWAGSPDRLVDALSGCGWLDSCADHRLIVHDWQDHAPDFVRKRLQRANLPFFQAITPAADNGGRASDPAADNGCPPCRANTVPCRAVTMPTERETAPTALLLSLYGDAANNLTARQRKTIELAVARSQTAGVPESFLLDRLKHHASGDAPWKEIDRVIKQWRELDADHRSLWTEKAASNV